MHYSFFCQCSSTDGWGKNSSYSFPWPYCSHYRHRVIGPCMSHISKNLLLWIIAWKGTCDHRHWWLAASNPLLSTSLKFHKQDTERNVHPLQIAHGIDLLCHTCGLSLDLACCWWYENAELGGFWFDLIRLSWFKSSFFTKLMEWPWASHLLLA